MKTFSLNDFTDQRKLLSHLSFILLALLATGSAILSGRYSGNLFLFSVEIFIMVLAQVEVFILIGHFLFVNLNFDRSPAEITRIVLFRFIVFIAACLFCSMVLYLSIQYTSLIIRGADTSMVLKEFIRSGFEDWFMSTVKGLTIGAVIFVILLWQTSLRREQKAREEKLIFQNETLKNQVNPHFLFNSLNTVSSLIKTNPDKADEFINNLSSVYRYILENGQKDKVSLESELGFMNRYFDLHRVRDEEKISLDIDYSGADNYQILPVSLQILLENAIKHNVASRDNPLKISVFFEGEYIVVKNNLQKKATQLKSTGIGLKNLTERAKLIAGKELITEKTDNYFLVKLPLIK